MNAAKKERLTKLCIAMIMTAMVGLCIAYPNEDFGSDCITTGQTAIIEDNIPPLAASVSKTTTKTTVKKSTKSKRLKKKAKRSKTSTKKRTKRNTSTKKYSSKTVKTQKTVLTTTKTITKRKSKKQKIQTTVKTTIRTTTTTRKTTPAAKSRVVKIRSIAPRADAGILSAFEKGGFKVVINPRVSYSGVFRTASKTIELKSANTVVYHELGHFVSYRTGRADSTSEFKSIYNAEKKKYTASNKAYVLQSYGEYFAESFKNYTENPSKLKKERPRTYAYVKSKVDRF